MNNAVITGVFLVLMGFGVFPPALAQFAPGIPQPPRERMPNQPPGMVPGFPGGMAPGQRPPAPGQGPRLEASGTVQDASPMGLVILSPTGQSWQLFFDRDCKLQLTGKALPDVLQTGLIVSFNADIEKKTGHATEPVGALVICSVDQDHMLGVFPEGSLPPGGAGGAGADGGGGLLPGGGLGGLGAGGFPAEQEAPRGPRSRRTQDAGPPVERFHVCGRISGIAKTGKVTVVVPANPYLRLPVQFELAENPDITLELSGRDALNFIVPGAKVSGKGVQIGPTHGRMNEITIELVEPVSLQSKKEARGNARSSSRTTRPPAGDRKAAEQPPDGDHPVDDQSAEPAEKPAGKPPQPAAGAKKAAGIDLPPLNQ